jgi:hypothetical protein
MFIKNHGSHFLKNKINALILDCLLKVIKFNTHKKLYKSYKIVRAIL